jgi:DNA-directed RNA polymerase specialized sigma24 family protein
MMKTHPLYEEKTHLTKVIQQNFGISEQQYLYCIDQAQYGDNSLLKLVFIDQYNKCAEYLINTLNLDESEARDISMDALLKFWDKFLNSKLRYGNLKYLLTKMAFQLSVKYKVDRRKEKMNLINIHYDENSTNDYCIECLLKSFSNLKPVHQQLLQSYYIDDISMVEYAKKENVDEATIRKRKQRAVEMLKQEFYKLYTPES